MRRVKYPMVTPVLLLQWANQCYLTVVPTWTWKRLKLKFGNKPFCPTTLTTLQIFYSLKCDKIALIRNVLKMINLWSSLAKRAFLDRPIKKVDCVKTLIYILRARARVCVLPYDNPRVLNGKECLRSWQSWTVHTMSCIVFTSMQVPSFRKNSVILIHFTLSGSKVICHLSLIVFLPTFTAFLLLSPYQYAIVFKQLVSQSASQPVSPTRRLKPPPTCSWQ